MDADQLFNGIARAVEAAKPAQEHCVVWCMTKAEWSGWMQAVGSILALAIAIYLPWKDRRNKRRDDAAKAAVEANVVIRYYREVLQTNIELLDVAIAHLPGGRYEGGADVVSEISQSIDMLRSLPFEQIRAIGLHEPELASDLASFHCERELIVGVFERNGELTLAKHLRTVVHRVNRLKELTESIQKKIPLTQNGMSSSMSSNPDDARGGGAGDRAGGAA